MFESDNIENNFFLKLGFSFDTKNLRKGQVLISEPFLADPNFGRSVVLITEYSEDEGAFGFIINKPTMLSMSDVVESFTIKGFTFHIGGPVNSDTVFFIHQSTDPVPESHSVFENLTWSGDFEEIKSRIELGQVEPKDIKFFGGYSGWSPGQLEEEVKSRSWIIGNLTADEIMNGDPHELWKKALKGMGRKFSIMAEFPENPQLN